MPGGGEIDRPEGLRFSDGLAQLFCGKAGENANANWLNFNDYVILCRLKDAQAILCERSPKIC